MREDKLLEFYISILLFTPSNIKFSKFRLLSLNLERGQHNLRGLRVIKNEKSRKRLITITKLIFF
jgi:hypothetical protein